MNIASGTLAKSQTHKHTILIVDDNPANLGVMTNYLQSFGFRILVARDGESALEKALLGRPDLILLDVLMPGIDGFETCQRLKANDALRDIPVLFTTALTETADKVKGFQAGGVDYVTKPIQIEELLARVQTHLALHMLHKQAETQNIQLQQEIVERKQAEEEIRKLNEQLEERVHQRTLQLEAKNQALGESETRYKHLLQSVTSYVYTVQIQHNQPLSTIHGPGCEAVTGYTPADYAADIYLWYRMIHEQDRQVVTRASDQLLAGEAVQPLEHRIYHKDGSLRWIRHTIVSHHDQQGQLEAYDGLIEDITERKESEVEKSRLLEETRRHLQRINALHAIDLALTSSFDLRLTINVLLEQVTAQLEVDAADMLLLNPHTQILEYIAGRGLRTNPQQRANQTLSNGYAGRAVLERTLICLPNLAEAQNEFGGDGASWQLAGEDFIAYYAAPLITNGQVRGVLEVFHRSPLEARQEWLTFLEALATQAAIAIDNASLFDALQHSNQELTISYDATLEGWARALELRDQETEGHSQRVTDLTVRLAQIMGISDTDLVHVRRGALLHDIGKMGIPDNILLKPASLTEQEWEIMHKHPIYAFDMLYPVPYLRPALDIPYRHHEKWDGSGYPHRLKGEQIPLAARIFAVIDVWDALISDRPYRKAWPEAEALTYIKAQSGIHFDPRIVEAFLKLLAEPPTNR